MNLKRRKNQYATARERFIEPALMNFLKAEFPFLGGKRVRMLFVEELMKILHKFYYSRDKIKLGQMRWLALSKETRPTSENQKFIPVTLTMISEEDIEKYGNGVNREEIVQDIGGKIANRSI